MSPSPGRRKEKRDGKESDLTGKKNPVGLQTSIAPTTGEVKSLPQRHDEKHRGQPEKKKKHRKGEEDPLLSYN